MLICPNCKEKLILIENRYVCENGHSHDISKYGHVNLLMSQKSGSRNHGDNLEMIRSRKNFLDSGAYSAMRDVLASQIISALGEENSLSLLDSGCGECYYTEKLLAELTSCGKDVKTLGIDISKDALRLASQRFGGKAKLREKSISLAVASAYSLPVMSESVDVLLSVFAPLCREEFVRVLKKDGIFAMVIPRAKHLWELKRAVYDTPYENEVKPYEIEDFELLSQKSISGEFFLESREAILDLFTMTPYFHKTSENDLKKLEKLTSLNCTYDFDVLIYKKI